METRGKKNNLFIPVILVSIFYPAIFALNVRVASAAVTDTDFYYYSDGRKIVLPLSKEKLAVRFKPQVTLDERQTIVESQGNLSSFSKRKEIPVPKITLLPLQQGVTKETTIQAINNLDANDNIEFASPVFEFPDAKLTLTDEFIVKFDPNISEAEIESFNTLNNVEIVSKEDWADWYVLRVKDPKNTNALKMANLYYENPITEFAVPNFIRILKSMSIIPDDTYFLDQWYLNNTGQSGGTLHSDIDAPMGWMISTGSIDIVIAIIDTGVDLTHPDLANKLVGGWDFVYYPPGDNDPSPGVYTEDAHGTACAGIAAAQTNNTIGVSGVAWGCKIMPIRVAYNAELGWITTDTWLAAGIQWAANNGADVLNNSWGGGPDSDVIHNAIINVKNNGRNGKGCVIVFASGNAYGAVSYPAKYSEVIAVGATDYNDVKWNYSNFGPELDVVAPSGLQYVVPLWTTDISGSIGWNPGNTSEGDAVGNYTKWMAGTSASAPQVAGLAALILSVNPDLTSDEVQSIIQSTADDKGAIGWDQYYGYGRINLFNALAIAKTSSLFLNKVDDINDGVISGDEITYTISYANPPVGDPNYIGDVNDAVITDFLPDYLVFSSASGPNSVYHPSSHTVTWNIGTLGPNDSCSVTLTVKVNGCITGYGIITNVCKIEGGNWARWVREETPVLCASSPSPACGEVSDFLCTGNANLNLTWCPGRFAADINCHEVYFGTNFNDVRDANTSTPGIYKGIFSDPCYPITRSSLELGTIYYWRIDEVNTAHSALRWKGSVWSFTADCYLLDNFDSYPRSEDLKVVWNDYWYNGTCAEVFTSSTAVRSVQSMKYVYYNQFSPYYSEAEADVNIAYPYGLGKTRNWLDMGATVLSLWFYGTPSNDVNEQMYIKLVDNDTPIHTAKVEYSDYGDMNDVKEPQWHQWNIPLEDFTGVNMSKVAKIIIGFGDGTPAVSDGNMFFEDIRLYLKKCFPGDYPVGDFEADCDIDLYDFAILAQAWLTSPGHSKYNPICDISLPRDRIINEDDLARFCYYWLWLSLWKQSEMMMGAGYAQGAGFTESLSMVSQPEQLQTELHFELGSQSYAQFELEPLQPEPQPQFTEEDLQDLIDWLEQLWLTDEEVRKTTTEAEWLEFIEILKQTPVE